MQYLITPYNFIALNRSVMTTSIEEGIIRTFYPERIETHLEIEELHFKSLVEQTDNPVGKPILILVRDPIERHKSLVAKFGKDNICELSHGCLQSDFKFDKAFKFPDQIKEFCEEARLPYPLPHNMKQPDVLPEPSKKEHKELTKKFKKDIKLYESL